MFTNQCTKWLVRAAMSQVHAVCHKSETNIYGHDMCHTPVDLLHVILDMASRPLFQVYNKVKGARILMCAPQNYSADLLFKALAAAGVTNDYMIRLNDPRVPPAQVSPPA